MARTADEIRTSLAEVDAAISAALKAQSYSMDSGVGRSAVTRVDLSELRAMRKDLESELEDAEDTTGGVMTGTFQRY